MRMAGVPSDLQRDRGTPGVPQVALGCQQPRLLRRDEVGLGTGLGLAWFPE